MDSEYQIVHSYIETQRQLDIKKDLNSLGIENAYVLLIHGSEPEIVPLIVFSSDEDMNFYILAGKFKRSKDVLFVSPRGDSWKM